MIAQTRPFLALLIVGLLLGGVVATAWAKAAVSPGTVSDAEVVRWVEKTVAERQAAAEDKRFDEIGWVTDIRAAIKLGKEHNRPIFLFTGNGRINTGRC
jgi:hypothetical protein